MRCLDPSVLLPRSGGVTQLNDQSVLLVGCGSVGSEIAHRLASMGVGQLTLADPDLFDINNLYRHTLSLHKVGFPKTLGLEHDLDRKFPWLKVVSMRRSLQDFQSVEALEGYDIVVIAIGNPTLQRRFGTFLLENSIVAPVVMSWLEGFGVGGHAICVMPNSDGCVGCAYVDPESHQPSLFSSLSFVAPGQNLTRTVGGCGFQFLPYNILAASQTANVASDLVVECLQGRIHQSARVSWKGRPDSAQAESIALTKRYHEFSSSGEILPLFDADCQACSV